MFLASAAFSDACVSMLVRAGADTGFIVTGNLTLLHMCAENGLELSVKSILETQSEEGRESCKVQTVDGNLPIHLAAMGGHRSIIELLLRYSPISAVPNIAVHVTKASQQLSRDNLFSLEMISSDSSLEMLLDEFVTDGAIRLKAWEDKYMTPASSVQAATEVNKQALAPAPDYPLITPVTDPAIIEKADFLKVAGNKHFGDKKYEKALECYQEALALQSDNSVLWSNSSATKLALGDLQGALRDAEICRRLRPEWTKGCYRLAAARLALGLYEDAAVAAFEGCRLDENNTELKSILQEALTKGQLAHKASTKK